MLYIKPNYYERFECIAGECPDTCCAGWNIEIDDESLDKYSEVRGIFGDDLRRSIDWNYGIYKQKKGMCMMLDDQKLCRIYSQMSPNDLCVTCREYPRHIEEFLNEREYSLSISCPWAAKLIVENEHLEFQITEDNEPDDFEEFDEELYDILKQAREQMLEWIQNSSVSMTTRHANMLASAMHIQNWIDDGRETEFESDLKNLEMCSDFEEDKADYYDYKNQFAVFNQLDIQRENWNEILDDTWEYLFEVSEEDYQDICGKFKAYMGEKSDNSFEHILRQIEAYYLCTYFLGAVYDDQITAKVKMVIFSVQWVTQFIMGRWKANAESISYEEVVEIIYKYAREIEHSDDNLDILETFCLDFLAK